MNNNNIKRNPIEYEDNNCKTNQDCFKQTTFSNTEFEQKKINNISPRRHKSLNPQILRNANKR